MEFEYPIVRRFIAGLIDGFLLVPLIFTLVFPIEFLMATIGMSVSVIDLFVAISVELYGILYWVLFETSKYRGTLGKLLLGVELVDTSGNTVRWWVSLGRCVFPNLIASVLEFIYGFIQGSSDNFLFGNLITGDFSILVLVCYLGSYLTVFFTKRRQTLWDMIFGTCVVRRDKKNKQVTMIMSDAPTT